MYLTFQYAPPCQKGSDNLNRDLMILINGDVTKTEGTSCQLTFYDSQGIKLGGLTCSSEMKQDLEIEQLV